MQDSRPALVDAAGKATEMSTTFIEHAKTRHIPGEVGMWVFIMSDLSVFSLYFITFLYERAHSLEVFANGSRALHLTMGVINTLVLLTSSLFVALGAQALRLGHGSTTRKYMLGAACGGGVFIINKPIEWFEKVNAGLGPHHDTFFQLYFMMTGLHLLHVFVGMIVLSRLWKLAGLVKSFPTPRQVRFMENGATYWHLVDLIWLVLFALFYLVG